MTRESQITKLEQESATGVLVAYRLMLSSLFVGTLICILVVGVPAGFLAYGIAQGKHYDIPVQLFVLLLGSLGAFFSALMRLYSFEHLPKALLEDGLKGLANWHLVIYSLVPPVTGAIGAIVLYYVFASGLVSGQAFPHFDCFADKFPGLYENYQGCKGFPGSFYYAPEGPVEYAKSLVWAFIAGFSERLIPDTLGKLEPKPRGGQT